MNLHLNLIFDSEMRSGSNVSPKFIVGVMASIIAIVLIAIIVVAFVSAAQARQNLAVAKEEKQQLDSVHVMVLELREKLGFYQRLLNEVEGWGQSRLNWLEVITELQLVTPANVQYTRMMVNERVEPFDGVPARLIMMTLKGRVAGKSSRYDVQKLDRDMRSNAFFSGLTSGIDIRLLDAAGGGEEVDVRYFDAILNCVPRKMGERQPVRRRSVVGDGS